MFSKKESLEVKGIAIILMFIHHLFGCGIFLTLESNKWYSTFGSLNLEYYIGSVGRFCIPLFLFCSGYGLYKSYISKNEISKKNNLIRIIKFCITYWVIMFLVAIPYLIYANKFNINYLIINLFALLHNDNMLYVSFSWYVKLYLGILIILPIFRTINEKIKNIYMDGIIGIILPISIAYIFKSYISEEQFVGVVNFAISSILLIVSYFPLFYVGVIFAKYNIIDLVFEKLNKFNKFNKYSSIILGLILMSSMLFLRYKINIWDGRITDIIYMPIFILGWLLISRNIKIKNSILQILGKYSFEYWLLSGMFFLNTVELQWILYIPRNSMLILVWKIILLTPFVLIINKVTSILFKVIDKCMDVVK